MTDIVPSFNMIQQESVQFNQPVSEASATAMGASINALLSVVMPVGTVVHTMLTEAQYQSEVGNSNWILADGRLVAGSHYSTVTGFSNVPDLRGLALRNKNNGRGDGFQNPDGDLGLGTTTISRFTSHTHSITDPGHDHAFAIGKNGSDNQTNSPPYGSANGQSGAWNTNTDVTAITINATGGNDTSPTNVTVNAMIRIN